MDENQKRRKLPESFVWNEYTQSNWTNYWDRYVGC
jgi:hypothetical protein